MKSDEREHLSGSERRFLELQGALLTQLLRMHRPPDKPQEPVWERFLKTAGGAALVTVALGGLLGNWVASELQGRIKERELVQASVHARHEQALIAYKKFLDERLEMIGELYELLGSVRSAGDDLISLTWPEFQLDRYEGREREYVASQRRRMRESFNDMDTKWRRERNTIGLLISYYHQGREDTTEKWGDASESLGRYVECARRWYLEYGKGVDAGTVGCEQERADVDSASRALTISLLESNRYPWDTGDSPDEPS